MYVITTALLNNLTSLQKTVYTIPVKLHTPFFHQFPARIQLVMQQALTVQQRQHIQLVTGHIRRYQASQ